MIRSVIAFGCLLAPALLAASMARAKDETGRVEIAVVDKSSGKPLPCRVHLKDAKGKGQKADKLPFWNDHFVCGGKAALDLPPGKYSVEVEHGPEYSLFADSLTLEAG